MLQLAWSINWELTSAMGHPTTTFSGPAVNKWYNSNQNIGWTINDAANGHPVGSGIAGFTQGWDSIPSDAYSEPHGAATLSADNFFTGPQFTNVSTSNSIVQSIDKITTKTTLKSSLTPPRPVRP